MRKQQISLRRISNKLQNTVNNTNIISDLVQCVNMTISTCGISEIVKYRVACWVRLTLMMVMVMVMMMAMVMMIVMVIVQKVTSNLPSTGEETVNTCA